MKDEDGRSVRFGSVGGGGRYDGLVGRFRGEDVPATGFSIGVSRLYAALKAIDLPVVAGTTQRGPVIVLVLDQSELARYQGFVSALRNEGIAAELYLGSSGMNAQLKYADKRNAVCADHPGLERAREGRDRHPRSGAWRGTRRVIEQERADYLELRTKAQFSVPEADLLKAVTRSARQGTPDAATACGLAAATSDPTLDQRRTPASPECARRADAAPAYDRRPC